MTRLPSLTLALLLPGLAHAAWPTVPVGVARSEAVLDDLDGDGDLDAVAASDTDRLLRVFRNDGQGELTEQLFYPPGTPKTYSVATGDLDGDAESEIVYCGETLTALAWVDVTAGDPLALSATDVAAVGYRARGVGIGDLDGDGHGDVVAGDTTDAWVYYGDGAGGFEAGTQVTGLGSPRSFDVADLDEDGTDDVVVSSFGAVRVLLGSLGGHGVLATLAGVSGSPDTALADLDDDGDLDLAVADELGVGWYAHDGAGGFGARQVVDGTASYVVSAADVDGDGAPELVVGRRDVARVVALELDGSETLLAELASGAAFLDAGDVDLDGDVDVLVATSGALTILDNPTVELDADADGSVRRDDCDDLDPTRAPSATEACDGIDQDCDGTTDEDMPDADLDGTCDALDACTGDDTTGDADADGTCDDSDFVLFVPGFSPGFTTRLVAAGAPAGARVTFLLGTHGTGSGPCAPGGTLCLDVRRPIVLGSARATAGGYAWLDVAVPATAPVDVTVVVQAAWPASAGGVVTGDVTEVDEVRVGDE